MAVKFSTKKVAAPTEELYPGSTNEALPVQLIALDQIKESPRNAKIHTQAQIGQIIASIKQFGFRDPIALDGNMELVEGHGRVAALRAMGATVAPAMVFKDMTPAQIRAYRIAHNQIAMSTGFDIAALTTELRDLTTLGMDLELTGFSMGDLESFELQMEVTSSKAPPVEGDEEEDEVVVTEEVTTESTDVVYQYVVIFDSKEQQQHWNQFIKHLKAEVEGETIAERIDTFLTNAGV